MSKWVSVIAGVSALAAGAAILGGLTVYGNAGDEGPPPLQEDTLHVRATAVTPADYPVTIVGFGAVAARREVTISPEVTGRIVELHPEFKNGGRIREGEVLFRIDPALYQSQLAEAEAGLRQQEATLERLRQEWANEKARHDLLEQAAALAEREFARAQELERKGVGSKVEVDRADRARLEAVSQRDLHARDLEVYPVRVREAQAQADSTRATAQGAGESLKRTEVRAPFTGRVGEKLVDLGQVVAAGTPVARLSDDSALEITVPVNSHEARDWLRFQGDAAAHGDASWFPPVEPVECVIRWAEDDLATTWKGQLDRVASYDPATRMVQVVVSHTPGDGASAFPLVAGMFCRVDIPGKPVAAAYRLPREAVTIDGHVHLAVNDRLKSVPVEILREEGEHVYLKASLDPGVLVVTTRLVDALDNTLLKVDVDPTDAGASPAAQ